MNGQLYQMARIVAYVKESRLDSPVQPFKNDRYEERIIYTFAGKRSPSDQGNETSYDTADWCHVLYERHLKRIFLLVNTKSNDPRRAGFANGEEQCIVTVFDNNRVTYWVPKWEFDPTRKMWTIYYNENLWENAPDEDPVFEDTTQEFKRVLGKIEILAGRIKCNHFASQFHKAYSMLSGEAPADIPDWMKDTMFDLEENALRMFLAASQADVFGGMGSWNDDPAGIAQEKGLGEEYDRLSKELYVQIRKAVMYAVNTD